MVLGFTTKFYTDVFVKTAILTIIPFLLVYRFRAEAILYLIIYLQVILLWVQAEISLRQADLSKAEFRPYFDLGLEKAKTGFVVTVHNISKNPAYNLSVARLIATEDKTKFDTKLVIEDQFKTLRPGKKRILFSNISEETRDELFSKKVQFTIYYDDCLGEPHESHILFLSGDLHILHSLRTTGFLLGFFEEIRLFFLLSRHR